MNTSETTTSQQLPEGAEDPDWIMRQQLKLLCRNLMTALGGTALCGVSLVVLLWPVTASADLLAWLGLLMVLTLARLLMQQGFLRRGESDDPRAWQQIFATGIFFSGVIWGALSYFLFPADSLIHQLYIAIVLSGLCAGAVTAYSPLPNGFLYFAVPALTPFVHRMATSTVREEQILALLIAIFTLLMSQIAHRSGNNLRNLLALQKENSRLAKALHHQATHDSLVELINHGEFQRRLERLTNNAREHAPEFCLVFIDLDLFKLVNDTGGHAAGDALLRKVANILRAHTRARDTAARIGGDEFALLLEACPAERALEIAEHVRRDIANLRLEFEGRVYQIGASIGVTYGRCGAHSASSVLKAADAACYAAKEGGRNRVRLLPADDMFKTTGRFSLTRMTAASA
ncbi:MAG: GGDEF domain-containing protein [Gammaproteobacteria bacterium]